jgi:flagellar protein FliL
MRQKNWTLILFVTGLVIGMFIGTTSDSSYGTKSFGDFVSLFGFGLVYGFLAAIGGLVVDFLNPTLERTAFYQRLIIVLIGIVATLLMVLATLFFSGFFDKDAQISKEKTPRETVQELPQSGGDITKKDDDSHFEKTYLQIDKEFMTNLKDSKKVMVVQIAIMTHYDNRVFDSVKKHEFAIRSAILDVMRNTTDSDARRPDFRSELAAKIKVVMNDILVKYDDFAGIDDVFFTSFTMQ